MVPFYAYKNKKSRVLKKSINNLTLTVHGRKKKFVVPFDTYFAVLLSSSSRNESFHVLLLGQTRCGFDILWLCMVARVRALWSLRIVAMVRAFCVLWFELFVFCWWVQVL